MTMQFISRDIELQQLRDIEAMSATVPQLTVITGRKRCGKTSLLRHAFSSKNTRLVYFYVERKNEHLLCNDLVRIAKGWLRLSVEPCCSLAEVFAKLFAHSAKENFTLVVDECQNLLPVCPDIFNALSSLWTEYAGIAKLNLIFCGSNHAQMTRIFDAEDAPMLSHVGHRIQVKPFSIDTLKAILSECNPNYTVDDLLSFCMITGGVPRYIEELVAKKAFTKDKILKCVLSEESYFLSEGYDMLVEDLGRDSATYFSILGAISEGRSSRGDITEHIGVECGGYLDKLERIYALVTRHRPYLSPDITRNVQYGLRDNFLTFWLRYIYAHRSAVEFGDFKYVLKKVNADYESFSNQLFKKYFRQKYRETGIYDRVVSYWERSSGKEIDLIAVDEANKRVVVAQCVRQREDADEVFLSKMAREFEEMQPGFIVETTILTTENI